MMPMGVKNLATITVNVLMASVYVMKDTISKIVALKMLMILILLEI